MESHESSWGKSSASVIQERERSVHGVVSLPRVVSKCLGDAGFRNPLASLVRRANSFTGHSRAATSTAEVPIAFCLLNRGLVAIG